MKIVISILVLLMLVIGIYYVAGGLAPVVENVPVANGEAQMYDSDKLGLEFSHSSKYFLVERDLSTGERERHSITLIEDTPANRALVAGEVEGAEGPTAITIDVFQNNLDNYDADLFIESVSDSNYKLAKGGVYPIDIDGNLALGYEWSGLYEGKSFVVARPDWVYMFSVTYLTPQDDIITDFGDVLEQVFFDLPLAEEGEI